MIENSNINFSSSDTWIMQTIIHCTYEDSQASLKDIISVGDMINHAIFLPGELQSGIIKLINNEYIEIINRKIRLSKKGKDDFQKVIDAKKSLFKERNDIQKILKSDSWKPNEEFSLYDNGKLQDFFTEKEFVETCRIYHKEAMQIVSQLTKNKET